MRVAEDVSSEGPGAPSSATGGDPKSPAEGAPATPASPAPNPPAPPARGLDWQLVALGGVLWLVAMGIVLSKWTRVRVDWQLGNIKERLDLEGMIDPEAVQSLIAMASSDEDVVAMLGDEVYGPQRNPDPRYRIAMVRTLGEVPGPRALAALVDCLRIELGGGDERVRATIYLWLTNRARDPADSARAIEVLEAMLAAEPEPRARSSVVQALAQLGKLEAPRVDACWYFIATFRDAEDRDIPPDMAQRDKADLLALLRQVRGECAASLATLSKVDTGRLPLDPNASDEARAGQVQAWEEWYVGQGGQLPLGQLRYPEWAKQQEELRARASAAAVATPSGGGGAGGSDGPGSQGPGG